MMDRPSFWRADGDRKDLDCDGCGRMWDEHSADGSYCPIEPESEIEALRAENAKLTAELAMATDAANKGDRARVNAGAMADEIAECRAENAALTKELDEAMKFVNYIALRYEEGWDEPITEQFYARAVALRAGQQKGEHHG